MKKDDQKWLLLYIVLAIITAFLTVSGLFARFNHHFPYTAGFTQFAIYATAGELLSTRILEGKWELTWATACKSLAWGLSGIVVTLAFRVFSDGVAGAMEAGMLPFAGSRLAQAFFTSSANNLVLGPIQTAFLRVCGNYADARFLKGEILTRRQAVDSVDWGELVDFSIFKTIPFFWIPINTVTFLLPEDYRIVSAAILSMAFGILMTILKLRERKLQSRQ